MVKMSQPHRGIPDIAFASGGTLPLEVLTLQDLLRRERTHDLSRPLRPAFHHLMLATRGEGTHTVDFVRHQLRAGSALHVAPGQVQQFGCEAGFDAWLVVFEPDFVSREVTAPSVPVRPGPLRLASLTALFEATAREFRAWDGSPRARSVLQGLVETIGLAIDVGPALPEEAALLQKFRAALERSFLRAHEVAAYAAILRCSTRTLTRHCERWAGRSPKRLIDERVALEARRLLAHGTQQVAELAEVLGFSEATQFGKFFRRLTGQTPAGFRKRFRPRGS